MLRNFSIAISLSPQVCFILVLILISMFLKTDVNVRLAGNHQYGSMGNCCSPGCRWLYFDGVFLCCPFSHEMSWMRSGTYLSRFLRVFLPTHSNLSLEFRVLPQIFNFQSQYIFSLLPWRIINSLYKLSYCRY